MIRTKLIILASLFLTATLFAQQQKPADKPKPPTKSSQNPDDRARALIPGLGGATPKTPSGNKGTGQPGMNQGPMAPASVSGPPANGTLPPLKIKNSNPFLYGANIVWGDNGGFANWDKDAGARARRLCQLFKGAGVKITRIPILWSEISPKRGSYDWKNLDRFVNFVSSQGLSIVGTVRSTPDWAISTEKLALLKSKNRLNAYVASPPEAEFLTDLGNFASALATRYKGKIGFYEFWDSPDGPGLIEYIADNSNKLSDVHLTGNLPEYTKMLTRFTTAVKKVDPSLKVAVGGLSKKDSEFLEGLYNAKADNSFDAISLHASKGKNGIAFEWVDRLSSILYLHRGKDKDKPNEKDIWISDYYWPTQTTLSDGVNPMHQARLIRETLDGLAERLHVKLAFYGALTDYRRQESDSKSLDSSGLCGVNLMPKPGYYAFRDAAFGITDTAALKYNLTPLTGGLPTMPEANVRPSSIKVTVDASSSGTRSTVFPRSFSQGPVANLSLLLKNYSSRLKSVGAKFVRFDPFPSPDMVQKQRIVIGGGGSDNDPPDLNIDWSYADEMVEAVCASGAKPVFCFGTMQTKLAAPDGSRQLPANPKEWGWLIRMVVKRYNTDQKRGITYFELGDQPDKTTLSPLEWSSMYRVFADSVRIEDPKAKVGGPGLSDENETWINPILEQCAKNKTPMDFFSFHSHAQAGVDIQRKAAMITKAISLLPFEKAPEIVISELSGGLLNNPANDTRQGAVRILTLLEASQSSNISRAFVHEFKEGRDFRKAGLSFTGRNGTITWDDKPKPALDALSLFNMAGAKIPTNSEETNIHSAAFKGQNGISVLLWRDRDDTVDNSDYNPSLLEDIPVRLQVHGVPWKTFSQGKITVVSGKPISDLGSPIIFQSYGEDIEAPIIMKQDDIVRIDLSPLPNPSVGMTIETPKYVVYGGSVIPMTVSLLNRTTTPRSVSMSISSSTPELIGPENQKLIKATIAPNETRNIAFSVKTPLIGSEGAHWISCKIGDIECSTQIKIVAPITARVSPPRADILRSGALPDSIAASSKIRVITENRSDEKMEVGIITGRNAEKVTLTGRQQTDTIMTVTAPFNTPGNYVSPVAIRLGDKELTRVPISIGVPAVSVRAPKTINIDGNINHWTKAIPLTLTQPTDKKGVGIFPGLSGQLFTQWDDNFLYVAAVVTGTSATTLYPPAEMWRGDSLQIAIDTRRNGLLDTMGYREWDYVIGISKARIGVNVYRFHGGKSAPALMPGVKAAMSRLNNRQFYEIAIPWSEIGMKPPTIGGIVGLSAIANNNDGQGKRYLEWGGGMSKSQKPGEFIGLRFLKD